MPKPTTKELRRAYEELDRNISELKRDISNIQNPHASGEQKTALLKKWERTIKEQAYSLMRGPKSLEADAMLEWTRDCFELYTMLSDKDVCDALKGTDFSDLPDYCKDSVGLANNFISRFTPSLLGADNVNEFEADVFANAEAVKETFQNVQTSYYENFFTNPWARKFYLSVGTDPATPKFTPEQLSAAVRNAHDDMSMNPFFIGISDALTEDEDEPLEERWNRFLLTQREELQEHIYGVLRGPKSIESQDIALWYVENYKTLTLLAAAEENILTVIDPETDKKLAASLALARMFREHCDGAIYDFSIKQPQEKASDISSIISKRESGIKPEMFAEDGSFRWNNSDFRKTDAENLFEDIQKNHADYKDAEAMKPYKEAYAASSEARRASKAEQASASVDDMIRSLRSFQNELKATDPLWLLTNSGNFKTLKARLSTAVNALTEFRAHPEEEYSKKVKEALGNLSTAVETYHNGKLQKSEADWNHRDESRIDISGRLKEYVFEKKGLDFDKIWNVETKKSLNAKISLVGDCLKALNDKKIAVGAPAISESLINAVNALKRFPEDSVKMQRDALAMGVFGLQKAFVKNGNQEGLFSRPELSGIRDDMVDLAKRGNKLLEEKAAADAKINAELSKSAAKAKESEKSAPKAEQDAPKSAPKAEQDAPKSAPKAVQDARTKELMKSASEAIENARPKELDKNVSRVVEIRKVKQSKLDCYDFIRYHPEYENPKSGKTNEGLLEESIQKSKTAVDKLGPNRVKSQFSRFVEIPLGEAELTFINIRANAFEYLREHTADYRKLVENIADNDLVKKWPELSAASKCYKQMIEGNGNMDRSRMDDFKAIVSKCDKLEKRVNDLAAGKIPASKIKWNEAEEPVPTEEQAGLLNS